MDKKYAAAAMNQACKDALQIGEYSYRSVMMFLKLQNTKPATSEVTAEANKNQKMSANHKFVRSMDLYQEELEFMN